MFGMVSLTFETQLTTEDALAMKGEFMFAETSTKLNMVASF
jgi:hypothetical protein